MQEKIKPLHADAKSSGPSITGIYRVQHKQERQNAATRQKKQEIEQLTLHIFRRQLWTENRKSNPKS